MLEAAVQRQYSGALRSNRADVGGGLGVAVGTSLLSCCWDRPSGGVRAMGSGDREKLKGIRSVSGAWRFR